MGRVAFHSRAYPGPLGTPAWALESQADMMLQRRGLWVSDLCKKPLSLSAFRPLMNDLIAQQISSSALPVYCHALQILALLFGKQHAYYQDVACKLKAVQD